MGPSQWVLEAVDGEYTGRRFRILDRGFTFGREADNDLVLMDDNISRHHAVVRIARDRPVLEDRNSRNGTFVNNQKVTRVELKEGDSIALGTHLFVVGVTSPDDAPLQDIDPERTVVAAPTSAQLRRTQAVQVFSPEAMAYQREKLSAELEQEGAVAQTGGAGSSSAFGDGKGGGPIFGGAAAPPLSVAFVPEQVEAPAEPVPPAPVGGPVQLTEMALDGVAPLEQVPYVDPLPPPVPTPSKGGGARRLVVLGGSVALLLIVGMAIYSKLAQPQEEVGASSPQPTAAPIASRANEAEKLFSVPSSEQAGPGPRSVALPPEVLNLSPEEKVTVANEHFDQGARFMESERLMPALEEFELALALNPDCKVCLIRISKVESEIAKLLEKYKSDALRSYQAMEYRKAVHYWELVLELERDPEGRRVATDGWQKAMTQLKQQSYR